MLKFDVKEGREVNKIHAKPSRAIKVVKGSLPKPLDIKKAVADSSWANAERIGNLSWDAGFMRSHPFLHVFLKIGPHI